MAGTDDLQLVPETSRDLEKLKHAITINQIIRRFTSANISLDHGLLVGLSDDDHPQYYNAARLTAVLSGYALTTDLANYYTITAANAAFAPIAHTHVAANISDFAESVDDRVATLLVAGANITLTYNDGANTLTISSSATTDLNTIITDSNGDVLSDDDGNVLTE